MTIVSETLVIRPNGSAYRIMTDRSGRHYFATADGTPHPVALKGPHDAAVTATVKTGDKILPVKPMPARERA
jgi:hypothetical protein